ncbi:MAG TPA: hypothetical protein VM425_08735 [Myxococcota bacterium]|nr:hypothetical protein [Myxococcota bacterium]
MSPDTDSTQQGIVDFFGRIGKLSGLLTSVTGGGLQAVLEFRETGKRLLLDPEGGRVVFGGHGLEGTVAMAGTSEDLHDLLLGKLSVIDGISERRLLLKGGMCHLVAFFPLFDLAPVAYAEHLLIEERRRQRKPRKLRRLLGAFFGLFFRLFAFLLGRALRRHPTRELNAALSAMSRGAARFSPLIEPSRPVALGEEENNPLAAPRASLLRRFWFWTIRAAMFTGGRIISLMKYKLGLPVDLFRVLAGLSRGLGDGPSGKKE